MQIETSFAEKEDQRITEVKERYKKLSPKEK